MALVFGPRVEDAHVREALALAVDRTAIHNVLLAGQGEISGALLPQWISGYAFLFPALKDPARARALVSGLPAAARALTLATDDRSIADRIALNARDVGLAVTVVATTANADVRLTQARVTSTNAAQALPFLAAAFGLGEPAKGEAPEALYAAERALLDSSRAVPLFHLPDLYAVSPRVKGGPGITPLGEWSFETLWIDRP
jgi:ABC-type oligopeptide transport system substrate-binding subunit